MYMTASSRRAGDDHRRPTPTGRLATRAALLVLMTLLLGSALAGSAGAAEPDPSVPPLTIGPGDAIPPPPPVLPSGKRGKKDAGPPRSKQGGKPAGGSSKGQGANGTKGHDKLDLHASCAPLAHTQTYVAWGPAVSYGGPVTVVYDASRCSTPDGSALDVAAEGTAQIFQGPDTTGALLDTKPFIVSGTWREPRNAEAWPPTWWDCSVPFANYTWQIPGVYTFQVSARDGVWSLNVSSQGVATQDVSWTHDGCA
jgi:hypothetical protein